MHAVRQRLSCVLAAWLVSQLTGLAAASLSAVAMPAIVATETSAGFEPTIALFYAATRDGRWFTPRYRLPTEGQPHHPQIVIAANGAAVVAWDELRNGLRRTALARGRVDAAGQPRFARREVGEAALANHPVVAAAGAGIVLAWTSGPAATSQIRVQPLP